MTITPGGPARQAARRRGDALARRPGRPGARQGAAARPAAGLHHAGRLAPRRARHPQPRLRLLAFAERPAATEGKRERGLLDRTTVRKNFKTVPYLQPGDRGRAPTDVTVTVELPGQPHELQAARQGGERDPTASGSGPRTIAVRLPVIVQPALPRFVRPARRLHGRRDRPRRRRGRRARQGRRSRCRASSSRDLLRAS